MRLFRKVQLWAVLIGVALLAVLSVVGAFLGAEGAGRLFGSVPLALFWGLFTLLLVVGLASFRRLLSSPGLLGMHLGALLILAGAIYGSEPAHRLGARLTEDAKVPQAFMAIAEGETTSRLLAQDLRSPLGELPFSVRLNDFRLERYPVEGPWDLVAEVPVSDPHEHEDGETCQGVRLHRARLRWEEGETLELPHAGGATVRVVEYLPSAQPSFPEGRKPVLVIEPAGEEAVELPAEQGRRVGLGDGEATVTIVQVFQNLRVTGGGEHMRVINVPGPPRNPAVKVRVERPEQPPTQRYVTATHGMHSPADSELRMSYRFPEAVGAVPDPDSELPAMKVTVRTEEQTVTEWLMASEGQRIVHLPLGFVRSLTGCQHAEQGNGEQPASQQEYEAALYMVRPQGMPKDYKSDLTVLRDGQPVRHKIIEVNDPLHHGGYHFYQHSYDNRGGRYTVLQVVSDRGLAAVYLGFALMGGGVFWWGWFGPVFAALSKRGADGD
ncbi:MAG: cytochrome c biogenesis protein ResB [Planctomycetota bacterium]